MSDMAGFDRTGRVVPSSGGRTRPAISREDHLGRGDRWNIPGSWGYLPI